MKESIVVHAQQILGALVMLGFTVRLQNPAHGVYEISYQQRIRGRLWEWQTQVQAVELFHQRGTPEEIAARYRARVNKEIAARYRTRVDSARLSLIQYRTKNEDPTEPANA
jgi:hypothetical protein